jgi:lipopolysaccharide biosynthesis glycosyltransferase
MPPVDDLMHIAIAFDQNYLKQFYALITSLITNNKNNKLHFHFISTGITEPEKKTIEEYFASYDTTVTWHTVDEDTVGRFVLTSKWTSAAYYRLYFPFLVPAGVKRLLYIDTDALVLKDLQELYRQELDGHPVGAVYDCYVRTAPRLGINTEGEYFNSGVLLIDIAEWKEQRISELAFDYLTTYPDRILFVDQDALNAVLINNWKKLPEKFNLLYSYIPEGISRKDMKEFIKDKVILHFTLQRPWHLLCKNRFRNLYSYYLINSPAKKRRPVDDFDFKKLPSLFRLRATEFYYDSPVLKKAWRKIKG